MIDFAANFTRFELEYGMFERKIQGVRFWQYIRDLVSESHLRAIYGFYSEDFLGRIVNKENKRTYGLGLQVKENLYRNQFFMGKRDVLIFACDRKVVDGKNMYRDVYTDVIDKNLRQSHYLLSFVRDFALPQASPNLIYLNVEQFTKVMGIQEETVSVSKEEFEDQVVRPLESYYDIQLDNVHKTQIHTFLKLYLTRRKTLAKFYNYILKKSMPKIILTVGIGFEMNVLCAVAKRKNIPVVVLQHGYISLGSFPYNSPKPIKISAYPDYMFVFGKSEKERGKFWLPRSRVIPVGYPELDRYIQTAKEQKTEIKKILILSCGDEKLLKFTVDLAGKIDKSTYRIIYKLHPIEYGVWENLYGHFLQHPNIEVVGGKNKVVYDYFMQADWVIGMFSTALYEATAFNVKIAILDSPYLRDYEGLFKSGRAYSIDGVNSFMKMIDSKDINSKADTTYFESNSMEKVQKAIDDIIELNSV